MLNIVNVTRNSPYIRQIHKLYDSSFPEDEKIPFFRLITTLKPDRVMHAYFDKDQLVGMSFVFILNDLVYLSYICVDEQLRDQGYGTEILRSLQKEYSSFRFVLDLEEVKPDTEGWQQRLKRKQFYLRNGFVESGVFYHIFNVDYELLCCNGPVSQNDWHTLIRKHWGRFADTAVYRIKADD